jgi:hypothetical protein
MIADTENAVRKPKRKKIPRRWFPVRKGTGIQLQGWKKPGFLKKKTQPSGFFGFFGFFWGFLGFFFYIFAQKRDFLGVFQFQEYF